MLPFVCVFLNFFLQCCVVFWVQVFYSLVRFILRYFIFLVAISNGIFFLISVSDFFCCVQNVQICTKCTKMPFISEYWLCIWLFCQILLLGRVVFWWSLWDFPWTLSCHLQRVTISFPPFQIGCLLLLFLVWLLWLGPPILCWIGVVREGSLSSSWS